MDNNNHDNVELQFDKKTNEIKAWIYCRIDSPEDSYGNFKKTI